MESANQERAEVSRGREGRVRVRRPLLLALGASLAGSLVVEAAGVAGVAGVLLGSFLWLRFRRSGKEWFQAAGVSASLCAVLFALAALRSGSLGEERGTALEGRWQVEHAGTAAVGRLDGAGRRFELPRGAAREGELLRLYPTGEAPRPARGPVGGGDDRALALPLPVLPDEIVRLAPPPGDIASRIRRGVGELRGSGLDRLDRLDAPLTRGLAAALLFGEKQLLPPGTADLFTRTGTRHALAVSGLHVALVASLWLWPVGSLLAALAGWLTRRRGPGWIRRRETWRALLLALFVPIAGSGAPVVRAALALALAQIAGLLPAGRTRTAVRRADALSLWALAGWIEWLASPSSLHSISVQLSYTATLGLILLAPPLYRALRGRLPNGGRIAEVNAAGRRRPVPLRLLAQKAIDWGLGGLVASIAANLATLPISWVVFGEWSAVGSLATLIILPLLALFLGLAWLWLFLPFTGLEWLLDALAGGMVGALGGFDVLPGTPIPLPERPTLLLALAGILCFARPFRARLACCVWGLLLLPWRPAARALEVFALDVGSGTAVVLRAPGEPCWIFDAGSRDRPGVARQALAPLLRRLDAGRVAVANSDTQLDHSGALGWLVERYPPEHWLGALPAHLAERLPHACPRIDLERGHLEYSPLSGAEPALELRLVRGAPLEGNEGSRSLEVSWGGHRLLLCGDAEGPGLSRSLERDELRGPLDLLLFPHHGSDTDFLGPLLSATDPAEIWISCGEAPAIAAELERRGLDWRSTERDGPLQRSWVPAVRESKGDPARFVRY